MSWRPRWITSFLIIVCMLTANLQSFGTANGDLACEVVKEISIPDPASGFTVHEVLSKRVAVTDLQLLTLDDEVWLFWISKGNDDYSNGSLLEAQILSNTTVGPTPFMLFIPEVECIDLSVESVGSVVHIAFATLDGITLHGSILRSNEHGSMLYPQLRDLCGLPLEAMIEGDPFKVVQPVSLIANLTGVEDVHIGTGSALAGPCEDISLLLEHSILAIARQQHDHEMIEELLVLVERGLGTDQRILLEQRFSSVPAISDPEFDPLREGTICTWISGSEVRAYSINGTFIKWSGEPVSDHILSGGGPTVAFAEGGRITLMGEGYRLDLSGDLPKYHDSTPRIHSVNNGLMIMWKSDRDTDTGSTDHLFLSMLRMEVIQNLSSDDIDHRYLRGDERNSTLVLDGSEVHRTGSIDRFELLPIDRGFVTAWIELDEQQGNSTLHWAISNEDPEIGVYDHWRYGSGMTDPYTDPDNDGLSSIEEFRQIGAPMSTCDPNDPDTDGDGVDDLTELNRGTDPSDPDTDGDGLDDRYEIDIETDPLLSDSDNDGLEDGFEAAYPLYLDPRDPDSDGDGTLDPDEDLDLDELTNLKEQEWSTSPIDDDSDDDGMHDGWEVEHDLLPLTPDQFSDPDEDGLINIIEFIGNDTGDIDGCISSAPHKKDTDGDGLSDGQELGWTDPSCFDTDGDTMPDGWEVTYMTDSGSGLDPLINERYIDHDGDGIPSSVEYRYGRADHDQSTYYSRGLDPLDADTDGDGLADGIEDGDMDGSRDDIISSFNTNGTETDARSSDSDNDGLIDGPGGPGIHGEDRNGNGIVDTDETSPLKPDTDGDGIDDLDELLLFELIISGSAFMDRDGDGKVNIVDPDSDDDLLLDGEEHEHFRDLISLDPDLDGLYYLLDPDTDGDGVSDGTEADRWTSPARPDTDRDGMPDGWELCYGLDPLVNDSLKDPDRDGFDRDLPRDGVQPDERFTNLMEFMSGTDPTDPDTDGDGISDGWEVYHGLDPDLLSDMTDALSYTASSKDEDPSERLTYLTEFQSGTDPALSDSDGDGLSDYSELMLIPCSDPTDPNDPGPNSSTSGSHLSPEHDITSSGYRNEFQYSITSSLTVDHPELSPDGRTPRELLDLQWDEAPSGKGIKVAVLDTGVQTDHPSIEVAGGIDLVRNEDGGHLVDDNGHGTHVAGIIGGNGIGFRGIAPDCDLFSVKVLDSAGTGTASAISEGIRWSIINEIDIIVMSFGSDRPSYEVESSLVMAEEAGIICFAAAGNDGDGSPDWDVDHPARHYSTICVGARDHGLRRTFWSSDGDHVDLLMPGVGVTSTWKNGTRTLSGTSCAAPMAAGIAALVLSKDPHITRDDIITTIGSMDPFPWEGGMSGGHFDEPFNTTGSTDPGPESDMVFTISSNDPGADIETIGQSGGYISPEVNWSINAFLMETDDQTLLPWWNLTGQGINGTFIALDMSLLDRDLEADLHIKGFSLGLVFERDLNCTQSVRYAFSSSITNSTVPLEIVTDLEYMIHDGRTDNGVDVDLIRYIPGTTEPGVLSMLEGSPSLIAFANITDRVDRIDLAKGFFLIKVLDLAEGTVPTPWLNASIFDEDSPTPVLEQMTDWIEANPYHWNQGAPPIFDLQGRNMWWNYFGRSLEPSSSSAGHSSYSIHEQIGLTNDHCFGFMPSNTSVDDDEVPDGLEILMTIMGQSGSDQTSWDTDGDGLSDGYELRTGTSVSRPDSDNDGLWDGNLSRRVLEISNENGYPVRVVVEYPGEANCHLSRDNTSDGDPILVDIDDLHPGQGLDLFLGHLSPSASSTDPVDPDTDNDGLKDGEEVLGVRFNGTRMAVTNPYPSDPSLADTDNDGLLDGKELEVGSDPRRNDTDLDGLSDLEEVVVWGSFPFRRDSDGDLLADRHDWAPLEDNVPPFIASIEPATSWRQGVIIKVHEPSDYTLKVTGLVGDTKVENVRCEKVRDTDNRLLQLDTWKVEFGTLMDHMVTPDGLYTIERSIGSFEINASDPAGNYLTIEIDINDLSSDTNLMDIITDTEFGSVLGSPVLGEAIDITLPHSFTITGEMLIITHTGAIGFLGASLFGLAAYGAVDRMVRSHTYTEVDAIFPITGLLERYRVPGVDEWINIVNGFVQVVEEMGQIFLRGYGMEYIIHSMSDLIPPMFKPIDLKDLYESLKQIIKYISKNGELWVDQDESEPEWGVFVRYGRIDQVLQYMGINISNYPKAEEWLADRGLYPDGYWSLFLSHHLESLDLRFVPESDVGTLVGEEAKFEKLLYPQKEDT